MINEISSQPENVLVTANHQDVKLVDFGESRIITGLMTVSMDVSRLDFMGNTNVVVSSVCVIMLWIHFSSGGIDCSACGGRNRYMVWFVDLEQLTDASLTD